MPKQNLSLLPNFMEFFLCVLKNVLFVKNTVLDTDLADTIHSQYGPY